jgi:hypothetical protein
MQTCTISSAVTVNYCLLWRHVNRALETYFQLPETRGEKTKGAVLYWRDVDSFFDVEQVGVGEINTSHLKATATQHVNRLLKLQEKFFCETLQHDGEKMYGCFSVKTTGGHVVVLSGLSLDAAKVCLLAGLHKYLLVDDSFVRDILYGDNYKLFMRVRGEM